MTSKDEPRKGSLYKYPPGTKGGGLGPRISQALTFWDGGATIS